MDLVDFQSTRDAGQRLSTPHESEKITAADGTALCGYLLVRPERRLT